ncbi:hypothetical protein HFO68_32940 [Rhizobium laguerreae]|uniref:DegT/DnrJ/EryC1/StrS family aminotransferase n=1 Tax=Rhizobium laguerreae TaxID=1076926 RepID=UPI001C91884D|nr:DegT/DnrJ/EryC1/StrS family aminotransferase [Rhizobium laguerreae]MBY3109298.1 hypothetical protein [Rhizobium laguerreae]
MLYRLLPLLVKLRTVSPGLYYLIIGLAKRFMGASLGVYPRVMGNELAAVKAVLESSQWNMAYGRGLAHERLEHEFADSVGSKYAIAVASGGVALQMSMRALGLKPGDETVLQVDTCSATALAVMNAGVTPIFADVSAETFMLDFDDVRRRVGPSSKALIATHMWGNPEDMAAARALANERGLKLIEDACLGLGAVVGGRPAGSWGDVGVFSFGCIKPIQTGEGGMIVTNDEGLARELRSLRHWGDRAIEFGVRDTTTLAWNGRMSELIAAVAREQLKGYPKHLAELRNAVEDFRGEIASHTGLSLCLGSGDAIASSAFTQVVLKLDETQLGAKKADLLAYFAVSGVPSWQANFELINSLTFFKQGGWRDWILRGDIERVADNYASAFPNAEKLYQSKGFGFGKPNFLSSGNFRNMISVLNSAVENGRKS